MGRGLARKRHCKHTDFSRMHRRSGLGIGTNLGFVGTGNGVLAFSEVDPSAEDNELWTVTFTNATNFGVVGSVSGANAAGTVGTPYTSDAGEVSFLITAGGTPFVNTDAFTFRVQTIPGYQPALNPSDVQRFDTEQTNRLGDMDGNAQNSVHDAYCADGSSDQQPGGRSNQFTFEDVQAAASANDLNLDT